MAERPSSHQSDPSSSAWEKRDAGTPPAADSTPGLGEQLGRTRDAARGLIAAHLKLLSAELSEIMGEIKKALALAGAALGLIVVAALTLSIGTILWLDEWAFGSIGWGALHGSTGLIALAFVLVLVILPKSGPRLAEAFFFSAVVAILIGVFFWLQLTSRGFGWAGDSFFSGMAWPDGQLISAPDRAVVVGAIVLAVVGAIVGALAGLVIGEGAGGRIGDGIVGLVAGAIAGGLLGGLLGVPMSWGCAVAVGLAGFFIALAILAPILVLPHADWDELKDRLMPNETIDTTKETIEWVREQMPLGRKS